MKTKVFIDAENVSVPDFEKKYRKKIKKFAKNHSLDMNKVEFRAYVVAGGPASDKWDFEGVSIKKIPGNPAKDKADKQKNVTVTIKKMLQILQKYYSNITTLQQ